MEELADEAAEVKINEDPLRSPRTHDVESLAGVDHPKSLPQLLSTRRNWVYIALFIVLITATAIGIQYGVVRAQSPFV
ncbi:hypothetical protein BD779DRAFT_1680013 [Infundibulicybe gibba]|nr:hypothetical protein BD779DRAFT_1680013 [Infundibulicybe gibba]